MTPDDDAIPDDDAVADAARRALERLAVQGGDATSSWSSVRADARRIRTRRIAAAVAVGAILLTSTGTALAMVGRDRHRVSVAATVSTTTSPATTTAAPAPRTTALAPSTTAPRLPLTTPSPSASTSTTAATTTTTTRPSTGVSPSTSVPGGSVPAAQPNDLAGTLTAANTTLTVGQGAQFSVTIRNVSNHPISFNLGIGKGIGVTIWGPYFEYLTMSPLVFAPGEQHTYTVYVTPGPPPAPIGPAHASVAFLDSMPPSLNAFAQPVLPGFAPLPVTILAAPATTANH